VVQDVFFSYWKKGESLEIKLSLESYLFGAVKRQCQNRLRYSMVVQKYESSMFGNESVAEDPYNQLIGNEIEDVIKNILNRLPDKTRKIFELNRIESKKYREIADELKISIKTIEAHMGKVIKLLRLSLSHYIYMIMLLIFL
jgi:RNA polymerase sigma-70 factor, ECF subfamily